MPSLSTNTDSLPKRSRLSRIAAKQTGPAALLVAAITLLLLIATLLIGWLVRQSMQQLARQSLESVLAGNVSAVELWLAGQREGADRFMDDDDVIRHSRHLLNRFAGPETLDLEALNADQAANQLSDLISSAGLRDSYVGWALMDTEGRVIASGQSNLIGYSFSLPPETAEKVIDGSSFVCRPIVSPVALLSRGPLSRSGAAVMLVVSPIAEGLHGLGSLALMLDPADEFSQLLAVSRLGETGETIAFDRDGILLSKSRFEETLRGAGVLEQDPDVSSLLQVELRVPRSDLTSNRSESASLRPLTLMADQATRGATGSNVDGYDSYLGVPVIGAWRWLPEHGIGIATEMQYAEAFSTMRILRNALLAVLAAAALIGLGMFWLLRVNRNHGDGFSHRALNRRMGQYDLGKVIGRGGMGSVYHGRHHLLCRDVAIKVLEHDEATTRSLSRFEREVQMTAKLRHPNTIEIYDYGRTDEGTFFYVMEYVAGISLQQLVDHYGRQPPERVIYLLLQICGSIAEAHGHSMVHRDIKPANILLTARAGLYDLVKVLDFGLVKEIDRETIELTRTDIITGTPLYMSPETVRDASKADARSDLYSIGAVGYTLLTGLPTFDGPNSADICAKQLKEEPLRPDRRIGQELPDDLQNVLLSCLRKSPDERPSSAEELADALLQCRDAGRWSIADACVWWESVFDGPRDALDDFNDNSRPAGSGDSPSRDRRSAKPGQDTKVDNLGENAKPVDQSSEKTAH